MKNLRKIACLLCCLLLLAVLFVSCDSDDSKEGTTNQKQEESKDTQDDSEHSDEPPVICEHTWVDADCDTPKTCSKCKVTEGEALGHSTEAEADRAATCTGKAYCSRCENEYGDEPLGHIEEIISEKVPTETENGWTQGKKCSVCGEILVEPQTIFVNYKLVYSSNGDGTCTVVDILINPNVNEPFTVVIPERSPDGDLVTAVATNGFSSIKLPLMMTEVYWNEMDAKIKEAFGITYHPTTGEAIYYPYPEDYILYVKWAAGTWQSSYVLITPEEVLANPAMYTSLRERYPLIGKVPVYVLTSTASQEAMKIWQQLLLLCGEQEDACRMDLEAVAKANGIACSLELIGVRYNKYVQAIELPDTVKRIGDGAFQNAQNLTSIKFSSALTSIGENAFENCTSLTNVTIPNSVTSIGYGAFSHCTALTSVTLPNQLTSIDGSAFSQCTSLTSITLPASVTEIASYAFEGCTGLTSIALPNGLKTVGEFAFSDCSSLKTITIPESVTFLGDSVFARCTSLESVSLPFVDGAENSEEHHFARLFGRALYAESIEVSWNGTKYYIPEALEAVTVTGTIIPGEAFAGCSSLLSLTVAEGVKIIGADAFLGCMWLKFITIADSVTEIHASFEDTDYYFNESNWENGVLYIGHHLIKAGTEISGAYEIKNGTKTVAPSAFAYCVGLTSITIPETVTVLGNRTFYGCSSLASISLPASLTRISSSTFEDTAYYTNEENWHDGALYLDDLLLAASKANMTLRIKDGTKRIAYGAFAECTKLGSILLSEPVANLYVGFSNTQTVEIYFLGTEEEWISVNGEASQDMTIFFDKEAKSAYAQKLAEQILAQKSAADNAKLSFDDMEAKLLELAANSSKTKLTMNAILTYWKNLAIHYDSPKFSYAYQIIGSEQIAGSIYEQLTAYLEELAKDESLSTEEYKAILVSIKLTELEATMTALETMVSEVKTDVQTVYNALLNATWRSTGEKNRFITPENQFYADNFNIFDYIA